MKHTTPTKTGMLNGPVQLIKELVILLQRKESSMGGRVNELKTLGLIEPCPMKINASRKPAMTYRAIVFFKEPLIFKPTFTKNEQGEFFGNPSSDPLHNWCKKSHKGGIFCRIFRTEYL